MILVLLGTQDKPFTRLLDAIQKQINLGNIKEKVVVQAGYTKYDSKNMEIFDLISQDKLNDLILQCDVLITHGGVGSILDGLKKEKKIIAAARLKRYGEHTNDHQLQIIEKFSDMGYIINLNDLSLLNESLKKIKKFKPKKYQSNTKNIIEYIENYIDNE